MVYNKRRLNAMVGGQEATLMSYKVEIDKEICVVLKGMLPYGTLKMQRESRKDEGE